jgi:hypothetical protein
MMASGREWIRCGTRNHLEESLGLGDCSLEELVIQPAFWKDRRVLLTGHTGFKGGWLAMWLQSMGARVVGYALPPGTQPNLFEIAGFGQADGVHFRRHQGF